MSQIRARVESLRQTFPRHDIDGFVVPHADEYQNEYLPACAERLAFISGFTGSWGVAVVLPLVAGLFVDGRYTLQAPQETDEEVFTLYDYPQETVSAFAKNHMPRGSKLGYDPWLHPHNWVETTQKELEKHGIDLVAITHNPLDEVWTDRPAAPCAPVVPHPLTFAGETHESKRQRLAAQLKKDGISNFIITDPCSLAWLLNIRGGDVQHTPIALGFAILQDTGTVDLFIDPRKLSAETKAHLGAEIRLHTMDDFVPTLKSRPALAADLSKTSAAIAQYNVTAYTDPCILPKACKNDAELTGARTAHEQDGIALVRFFAWLSRQNAVDELTIMAQLRAFRAEGHNFRDLSFETIAGSGANGAIVHYRADESSNRILQSGEFLLLDSGGQYLNGTTDVTRTVAFGEVSAEMKDRFTRVLKGHIAVASAIFPIGTTGSLIDSFARRALWDVGLDFGHRTGHGVGSYLSVHEGPTYIGAKDVKVPLQPGMILSNEPGYYKTGAYGIRIESLLAVRPMPIEDSEREMLGFETLTLCPIDRSAIEVSLLTAPERNWLNAYHARVRETLTPHLNAADAAWLKAATETI